MNDEGLAAHARGDVPGEDTDAIETEARERVDADALRDEVAPPPPAASGRASSPPAATGRASSPPAATSPGGSARSSGAQVPISTAAPGLPPPKASAAATSGPTPACPQCEAPMAWVEEHLRFYCKQCRMYF